MLQHARKNLSTKVERNGASAEHAGVAFRKLWKEQYRQDITNEQAEEYEDRIARLMKLLIDIEMERERSPP